jgi:ABC-2 type transport system permease protein
MSRLRALVGVDLKNHFAFSSLWWRIRHDQKRWRTVLIAILVALWLVPLLAAFILSIDAVYAMLHEVGQESALIVLGVIAGQMVVFILGLFYVISAFYFSSDLERLIPLPFKPREVVVSKLIVVIINEYFVIMPIVLPCLLGYGILARAPLDYWILLVPVYFLLPIIPLTLSALLAIGLMRVVNLSRRKDALIIVGSLLFLAVSIWFQMRTQQEGDSAAIMRFLSEKDGLVQIIGRNFPPSVWASRSLTLGFSAAGVLQFLLLAGASGLVFFGMIILSEKFFYKGVIGLSEVAAERRKLSRAELEKRVSSGRHPIRAILQREIRLMNRTPIFLLNGVLTGLIVPVIFLVGAKSGGGGGFVDVFKNLESTHATTLILGSAAFFLVCGCINGTASSTFSREGKHFWISKVIPVPWRQQVAAKFLHSYLVSLVGIVAAAVVAAVVIGIPAASLCLAMLLALAGSAALNVAGMRIDLARPLLKWTNPQQAIKQNFNVLFAMIVEMGFLAACGFAAHYLMAAGLSGKLVYVVLLVVAATAAWIAWRELLSFAEKKYCGIEA